MKRLILSLLCFSFAIIYAQKGYYRTPALNGNNVVFTAEGDLWKHDMQTGQTIRLTTHHGVESNPLISPDGKRLAFVGQLEGASDIYLMDLNGGVPQRLTYDFGNRLTKPVAWTADGKIMYVTMGYSGLPNTQLALVDLKTKDVELVPLAQASDGCIDGSTIFFTRLPKMGSNAKRYKGGYIEQLWKFDGTNEAKCLSCDFAGTSTSPMLYKDRLYFISDRDGSMNIWSTDKEGKSPKQHTSAKEWDIKSPAINGSRIVYQMGADLYVYDIDSGNEKKLDITLVSDFVQRKPRWFDNPSSTISHSSISPDGDFVSIVSRGRLFVAPAAGGRWVEIGRKSGVRVRQAHFLTRDQIVYLSDESGEFELWRARADGGGAPQQLTHNSTVLIMSILPSPEGRLIAYADRDERLRIIDASTGATKFEYVDKERGLDGFSWSSNSRYLTYDHSRLNTNVQISVIDLQNGGNHPITTTRLDSYEAGWTKDDNWIYFLSDRDLHTKVGGPWGKRQPEPYYSETTQLYAVRLDKSDFPFTQPDPWKEEQSKSGNATSSADSRKGKGSKGVAPVAGINWTNVGAELFRVPIKSNNASQLMVGEDCIYWIDNSDNSRKLYALKMDWKKVEPVEVADGIQSARMSANKKHILIYKRGKVSVIKANGEKADLDKTKVELQNWSFSVDPQEDWKQMFDDAWRMMRDYFYDRNMHGVDWKAVRQQHLPLVDRLTDRDELDDLIAHMVAELSVLHSNVGAGDPRRSPDNVQTGFLGALLKRSSNGVLISHIYENDPDYPDDLSPLAQPGLSINNGDVITKIDDIPVTSVDHYATLLANKVGVPVKLTISKNGGQQIEQVVKPISAGTDIRLRYAEWEYTRRLEVDRLGNNEIGYIHLQAMGSFDMDAFVKQYYPVFNRKGLIIDVRHNRGGNIDSWILEKLMRKIWFYWQSRTGPPYPNMQYAFNGHMVMLVNQFTASDGEAVAEGFRRLGLGKVIGMRTWGGEIWLSRSNRLVDNGVASAPETGVYGLEREWLIEGHGVEPDFVVDNLPHETFNGKDSQLEYAIGYLKKKIQEEPVTVPEPPAYPNKSFTYKKD